MSFQALSPTSTIASSGATPTSGTIHGCLSDGSGTNVGYVETSPGSAYSQHALADLSLPGGAQLTRVLVFCAGFTAGAVAGYCIAHVDIDGVRYSGSAQLGNPIVNIFPLNQVAPESGWTDADIDGAVLTLVGYLFDASGMRLVEAQVLAYYVVTPVTDVTAPSGTFTTNNRPAVTWANTLDGEGGSQSAYEVKIFSAAQYGAGGFNPDSSPATQASGIQVGGAQTWTPPVGLANATYRAYVRVAQTVNGELFWSAWDFLGFTINTPAPATPTLVLTPDSSNGRIIIDVDDNSGSATTDAFLIQRSLDGGTTWENLRVLDNQDGIVVGNDVTVWDYEAPNGQAITYRAYSLHNYSGAYTPSLAADTETATWSSNDWWLKVPELPDLNMIVDVDSFAAWTISVKQAVVQVLGRRKPVIVGDGRSSRAGTVAFKSWSPAARGALMALLDSDLTLLLQGPVAQMTEDDALYLRAGEQARTRIVDKAYTVDVIDTVAFTEVDAPTGPVVSW